MTTFMKREIVTRRVEYGATSGCDYATFDKIASMAHADWKERTASDTTWDDWAHVEARDEELVVWFQVEETGDADRKRIERAKDCLGDLLTKVACRTGSGPSGALGKDDLLALRRVLVGPEVAT